MYDEEIIVTERQGVRLIKFNRPRKKNAFNSKMYQNITRILNEDAKNDNIVLTILTGNGDFFSSGNDVMESIQAMNSSENDSPNSAIEKFNNVEKMIDAFIDYPKIIVAVVNGPAIGIGATILPHCDIVYASDKAYFDLPFLKLGLCCEGVSSYFYPRIIGRSKLSEMLYFGEKLSAEEAFKHGLISKIIPNSEINNCIEKLMKYGNLPVEGVKFNKSLIMRDKKRFHDINRDEMKQLADRKSVV